MIICLASSLASAATSGRARLEEQYFHEKQIGKAKNFETSLRVEFEQRDSLSETWKLRFEPRVRVSTLPHAADVPIDGDFRDTLAEKNFGAFRLQAGSFIKAWEGTDGLNPMDIATVKTYRDPINSESIGSIGVAGSGTFNEIFSFDVLYVPWQTPTRLPGNSSAWWPQRVSLPLQSEQYQALIPDVPEYDIQRHGTLNYALENNYGARLQMHLEGWDFSAAYFEGAAQLPVMRPFIAGNVIATSPTWVVQMTNPVAIQPIEYRRRTVAGGFVRTWENWIFRLFGRYDQPIGDSGLLPGWSDQVVGGVERTLTVGEQSLTLVGQFSYTDRSRSGKEVLGGQDPFARALLLGVRAPLNDDVLIYVSALIDTYKDSSVVRASVERKLGTRWTAEGAFEWIRGSDASLLGQWKRQNRSFLSATYRF